MKLKSNSSIFCVLCTVFLLVKGRVNKNQVDKLIEDDLTQRLGVDLLQSIEKKFQVDLERSVDAVLQKINLLLQNGTLHIQDKLVELQSMVQNSKKYSENELNRCLKTQQVLRTALIEKALHQMVLCGYSLIGYEPSQALRSVVALKNMIKKELEPLSGKDTEVHQHLRDCGHDHNSLKKVIKCVISKSPKLKSAMMSVSGNLVDGIVHITKLIAHGAMHDACLIEVLRSIEDDALVLIKQVQVCANANGTQDIDYAYEAEKYIKKDNATVLDFPKGEPDKNEEFKKNVS